jgi:hypothetical protein
VPLSINTEENSFPTDSNSNDNFNIQESIELITKMMSQMKINSCMPNVWYSKLTGSDNCSQIDVEEQWKEQAENCDMSYPMLLSQSSTLLNLIQFIIDNTITTNEEDKEPVSLKDGRDKRLKYPKPKIQTHLHFLLIIITMTNWQTSHLICGYGHDIF